MKKILAVSMLALLLTGCDKPTIDTTSDESMKASIAKVRESLPEDKRAEFDNAINVVAFNKVDWADIMKNGLDGNKEDFDKKMREPFAGKTGEEIISYAKQVTAEREARQKEQAILEIKELEAKKLNADKTIEELKKFEIIKSRFSKEKQQYGRDQPVIRLVVKNNTNHPISRAFFHGIIASEGRSVPWFEDDFNYVISGGLEPGEQAEWALAPDMFSEWGEVNAPSDAVFTVTVQRLDGADKKPIFDASSFTEKDKARLDDLKQRFK
ncbi:hypothetical protein GIX45_18010 [Erwinia sp. CPCC 100877]|nr:hypothetical protein [Erwinia sp. CPCC 100877]